MIAIEPFSPESSDPQLVCSLIECYRTVFAGPPWNEWLKCANRSCGAYWGSLQKAELLELGFQHCGQPVVDYRSYARIFDIIVGSATKDRSCWVAIEHTDRGSQVVGFTWSDPLSRMWDSLRSETKNALRKQYGDDVGQDPTFIYQYELGVLSEYRGRGIARKLVRARHKDVRSRGARMGVVCVRELPNPSVTFLWYTRIGYQVAYRYPKENGRVILVGELTENLF